MSDWPNTFAGRDGTTTPVVLAHELPFRVGALQVEPALRLVSTDDGREEILQPRTMQVLVSLARSTGKILSRDDLTESCWSGTVVGDDSINRVIAQLRKLAEGIGDRRFAIETITKVGYRLIELQGTPAAAAAGGLPAVTPTIAPTIIRPLHKRPLVIAGVAAALLLAVVTGISLWPATTANDGMPELAITTSAGPGTAPGAAQELHDEMASVFGPESLRIVDASEPGVYQLTAKVANVAGEQVVFGELRPPGKEAPIWSPRITVRDSNTLKDVAKILMFAAWCDVDSGVTRPPVNRSAVAVSSYASYCEEASQNNPDNQRLVEMLRIAVKAEPRFFYAQAYLAILLGTRSRLAGPLRAEAQRAADAAARLDPLAADVPLARFYLTADTDFAGRDTFIRLAVAAKPTRRGIEFHTQGHFLRSTGRSGAMLVAYRQSDAAMSNNTIHVASVAMAMAATGQYDQARQMFAHEARIRNDPTQVNRMWLEAAMAARDWDNARKLVASSGVNDPTRAALALLIEGLAGSDKAKVNAAGSLFEAAANDPATMSPEAIYGLGYSDRPIAAVAAEGRMFDARGVGTLRLLYTPSFAAARKTPEFAAFVTRIGLADYWRKSGNLPDFCLSPGAPALCATLRRRT